MRRRNQISSYRALISAYHGEKEISNNKLSFDFVETVKKDLAEKEKLIIFDRTRPGELYEVKVEEPDTILVTKVVADINI